MARPPGSKNKIKKPEFIREYEKFRRQFKLDPVAALFAFAKGETAEGNAVPGITAELMYRACRDLVTARYAQATVAKFEEAQLQQDLFDSGVDNKIVFGLGNDRAA